jgi:hypothetical protein
MRKIIIGLLLLLSFGASAQWQQTGSKVRYVNGLGIPTKDTAAGVAADSSQILIRPADSSMYIKYKRTWIRVGGGGGSIGGSGTTNRVPKFTASGFIGNSSIVDSASAVAMTINSSGNVGIGTANPLFKVDVVGGQGIRVNEDGAGTKVIFLRSDFAAVGPAVSVSTAHPLLLQTTNTERMRITAGGNVLIGTTTDNGVDKLQVSGSALVTGNFVAASTSGNVSLRNTASTYAVNITTGSTSGIGMYQDAGTAVIIGTNAAVTAMSPISIRGTTVDLDNNLKVNAAGRVLIGNPTPNDITGEAVQVNGAIICDQFKLWGLNTAPASASATGTLGEIRIDANYIYICTATNTWKRVAIATW